MNKKIKGSSILVVIFSTIIIITYITSVNLEQVHFEYISKEYKQINKKEYEKDIQNIDEVYDKIIDFNMYKEVSR